MFLRKGIFDSLSLDAWTFEKVPNRRGDRLTELWATDAATIEFVIDRDDAPSNHPDWGIVYEPVTRRGMTDKGDIEYVQVIDGQVEAEYTCDELAYMIRNPKTDVRWSPFGVSELEVLIEIVTAVVNSVRYNSSYFTASSMPQGVLEIVGKYQQKDLEQFSRFWKTMTTGAAGKWKVPVMALEDGQGLKFTNFKQSNRDMEFVAFLDFLLEIGCAVYQIDKAEVGFSSQKQKGLIQSDSTKAKVEASQDKGLVPLMEFVADSLNHEVIDVINPDFAVTWVGLSEEDEDAKWDRVTKRLTAGYSTVAMERAKNDEEVPKGAEWDWMHKPLNTVAAGYVTADQQAEQQQQQQAQQQQGQMDLANQNHKNAMEQAEQKHGHAMAQGTFTTLAQGAQKAGLAEQANDHKLQQQTFSGLQQGAIEHQKGEQAMAQADQGHKHDMEQAEQAHGHQMLQSVVGSQLQGAQAAQDHKNSMEQADQAHGHQMAQSTFQGLQAGAQQAQQHQNAMEQNEQKAAMQPPQKKPLKKSFEDETITVEVVLV